MAVNVCKSQKSEHIFLLIEVKSYQKFFGQWRWSRLRTIGKLSEEFIGNGTMKEYFKHFPKMVKEDMILDKNYSFNDSSE